MNQLQNSLRILFPALIICLVNLQLSRAEDKLPQLRQKVSQHGITWTFSEPALTGRFITGDWWVIGPVTVIKTDPVPGPLTGEDMTDLKLNQWGDTSLKVDSTMRNGSMIVLEAGRTHGYDSRNASFRESASVNFPLELSPGLSLISSISNQTMPVDNFCRNIMWDSEQKVRVTMKAAAVLTCLNDIPPEDSFRPPYAGTLKPLFRATEIRWKLLPRLEPRGELPSWEEFERYLERPWIDHLISWEQQQLVPNENGPNYGREHSRIVSIASLMLMLDEPVEKKEKLTIGLIQRGIDLYGLAMAGGYWNEGGGHSSGRKWPVIFAAIMLDKPWLANLPDTAVFQEDTQTYYGQGWFGQTALWWMIMHHGRRDTYEEKHPDHWEKWDKVSESYRICCTAVGWVGTALAARYLKAIKIWGHDAFFDYVDRWMREDDPYVEARDSNPRPGGETQTFDPFVTDMWRAYRASAPEQEMAGNNMRFIWEGNTGKWIPNPKHKIQ